MIHSKHAPFAGGSKRCVVAVHGSLSSGRLWARLADELGPNTQMIAPDVSGYGGNRDSIIMPERLSGEVALLAENNVTAAAAAIGVPTLLFSGGLSPYLTQRIVGRLASLIAGVDARHLPAAGHMMALSHAKLINPEIAAHIARAELAEVPAGLLTSA